MLDRDRDVSLHPSVSSGAAVVGDTNVSVVLVDEDADELTLVDDVKKRRRCFWW